MVVHRTGSKQLLRDLNKNIVLNLIVQEEVISRSELARRSRLPAATITYIVNEFINAGLVTEVAKENTGNGRPPFLLQLNVQAGYVIGVKLQEKQIHIVICDLACAILHSSSHTIENEREPYRIVRFIADCIKQTAEKANIPLKHVLGVGIGLAGVIDSPSGTCRYSPFFQWRDVELGPALEFLLHIPVRIDNDVNTLAIAEHLYGAGKHLTNFLVIVVGRGVGLGVVMGGEIYRGNRGGAGELGHIQVDLSVEAPLCHCGKRGCLEAFVADYALVARAIGICDESQIEGEMGKLMERARSGDAEVLALFSHAGAVLGSTIANLINLFDPARIILSGLYAKEFFMDAMHEALEQGPFMASRENDSVRMLEYIEYEDIRWARGAASLIMRELFLPPLYEHQTTTIIDDLLTRVRHPNTKRR